MKILSWLVALPLAAAAAVFAVSNRGVVRLDLWPLPYTVDLPLYLLLLAPLALGIVLGGLIAWAAGGRWRREARAGRRRIVALEAALAEAQKPAAAAPAVPALRNAANG